MLSSALVDGVLEGASFVVEGGEVVDDGQRRKESEDSGQWSPKNRTFTAGERRGTRRRAERTETTAWGGGGGERLSAAGGGARRRGRGQGRRDQIGRRRRRVRKETEDREFGRENHEG